MNLLYIIILLIIIYYFYGSSCSCINTNNTESFLKLQNLNQDYLDRVRKIEQEFPNSEYQKYFNNLKNVRPFNDDSKLDITDRVKFGDDKWGKLSNVFSPKTVVNDDGRLNISVLPMCNVPMKIDYIQNNNFLINTGDLINFDIYKPDENKAMIYNKSYHLTKLSWAKSLLNWNSQKIDLEIRFTHINISDGKAVHIIFPLIFTDNTENFGDTFFELEDSNFDTSYSYDKNKISTSMKSGLMYPILQKKNIIFDETQKILDEKGILNEIYKDNQNLANQKTTNFMKPLLNSPNLKSNMVYQNKKITFYTKKEVLDFSLDNLNNESKIDLTKIPNTLDLEKLHNQLTNINFSDLTKRIKNVKYTVNEIETLNNLDTLIIDESVIPNYICCNPSITGSKLLTIDFFKVEEKILSQDNFYYTNGLDSSLILITKPYPFNRQMGKKIYDSLDKVNALF